MSQALKIGRGNRTVTEWQERYCEIVTDEGMELPFLDNEAQRLLVKALDRAVEMARERHQPARGLIIKPRRAGFTTKMLCRQLVRACTEEHRKFLYINANKPDTLEGFSEAIGMWERLPLEVRPTRKNSENMQRMDFVETRSSMRTKFASVVGGVRGKGYAEGLWDEIPRVAENLVTVNDQERFLNAGTLPAFRYAPFWCLFTPDGTGDIAYDLWTKSKKGENDWARILITHWQTRACMTHGLSDADQLVVIDTLTEEEKERLGIAQVPEHEWAKRIHWRRMKQRELGRLFYQEYPEDDVSCWIAPGTAFFDQEAVAHQARIARPHITQGRWAPQLNGALRFYVPPREDGDYLVASDFGMGRLTGDPSMSAVLDLDSNEVVACLHGNYEPEVFTEMTIRRLCTPYNEALWAPESNLGPGRAGLVYGRRVLNYFHLYLHARQDGTRIRYDNEFGWPTDNQTRPVMLEDLDQALREAMGTHTFRVNDPRILADLQAFKLREKRARPDRYEAEKGAHDEGVIVLGILNYIRSRGLSRPSVYTGD